MPKHVTVLLANIPGAFDEVAHTLAEADINIWVHHLANMGKAGFVQMICIPHVEALRVLRKKYGYYVTENDVLAVRVQNIPGALLRVLELLKAENLNLVNSYATFDARGNTLLIFELESSADIKVATDLLTSNGFMFVEDIEETHERAG